MNFVAIARNYLVCTALTCFALGAAAALLCVWLLGTPWKSERVVEVEKVVEKVVEKPVVPPAPKQPDRRSRADLIVMKKNQPLGLDSDFSEFFVEAVRRIPEVESVSEGVVSSANAAGWEGIHFLVQGRNPDNFGFENLKVLEGRMLQAGDKHKVMIGQTLASNRNLNKKVGDTITFAADPDTPYEVVGVFKSPIVFEEGGVIVPLKDGQALTGKKVTGFSLRVKKSSPNPAADIEAVRQKIEALRDPKDPTARLDAVAPEWR